MAAKVNYLNNKDLMKQIHKSKNTYCYFENKKYEDYDVIVNSVEHITSDLIKDVLNSKAEKMTKEKRNDAKLAETDPKTRAAVAAAVIPVLASDLNANDLVFRVMTYEHVPIDAVKKEKRMAREEEFDEDEYDLNKDRASCMRTNFPPFKHYVIESCSVNRLGNYKDVVLKEVGRSHWLGNLKTGKYSVVHGQPTRELANMYIELAKKYANLSKWRGYTYLDEMIAQGLLQLSQIGLQFDESRSQNPFAYYTETLKNSFRRILNVEKKNQTIRDDLLIASGSNPSMKRQLMNEDEQKKALAAYNAAEKKVEKKTDKKNDAKKKAA